MRRIGISIGDVNGIGPEITLKALLALQKEGVTCEWHIFGPESAIRAAWDALGLDQPAHLILHDVGVSVHWKPGQIHTEASLAASVAIREVVSACLDGSLNALVTAPICKEGFHRAGVDVPGHTELLAALTQTQRYGMLLMGGGLRVMLATRHLPLRKVAAALTVPVVQEAIELVGEALPLFGVHGGKIGVCGLNPHAGDGGVLGAEEQTVILPAIEHARLSGFTVSDPVPADTIFYEALQGRYDAVVAMYHDQGLAPLKMIGFEEGVNMTLGLPIIRTSPDHGTAFGIAGKKMASSLSMQRAIETAHYAVNHLNRSPLSEG